jgi:uncharacterized coiled-coil protein SlyX
VQQTGFNRQNQKIFADTGPGRLFSTIPGPSCYGLYCKFAVAGPSGAKTKTAFMCKPLILSFIPAFLFVSSLNAQSQSYNSSLSFQKNKYAVATIQVPFEADVVTSAVKDYMVRKGFTDSRYKDFMVFRSVPLVGSSTVFSDAYFNINRKSRSEKDISVISLLPVKKGQTLLPASAEDSSFISHSLVFLDSLRPYILNFSLRQEILAQQETLGKINSKITGLKNDSGDIVKKIRGYEGDLTENKSDQEKQTREINNISTGDQSALAKAHKRMDRLMNRQTDYEKKLRNAREDLDKNRKALEMQRSLADKEFETIDSLKLRRGNLGLALP